MLGTLGHTRINSCGLHNKGLNILRILPSPWFPTDLLPLVLAIKNSSQRPGCSIFRVNHQHGHKADWFAAGPQGEVRLPKINPSCHERDERRSSLCPSGSPQV